MPITSECSATKKEKESNGIPFGKIYNNCNNDSRNLINAIHRDYSYAKLFHGEERTRAVF